MQLSSPDHHWRSFYSTTPGCTWLKWKNSLGQKLKIWLVCMLTWKRKTCWHLQCSEQHTNLHWMQHKSGGKYVMFQHVWNNHMIYCFCEMCIIQPEHTAQNTVLHNATYNKWTRLTLLSWLVWSNCKKVKTSSLWQYAVLL